MATPERLQKQRAVLREIGPSVSQLLARHEGHQQLWYPTELLEEGWKPTEVSPELMAVLVTNMLTEEGLPHFFGLLVTHLGTESPWKDWINLWTAEENRHGKVLDRYLNKALTPEQMICVEQLEYGYLRRGFNPNWGCEPYRLLAYVVLQERATEIAHGNVAREARRQGEHVLGDILDKIVIEETKHFAFFRSVFKLLLEADPVGAVIALAKVVRTFSMPGVGIPGYRELFDVAMRTGMFTGDHLHRVVENDVIRYFQLGSMPGLGDAEPFRDGIMRRAGKLKKEAADFRNRVPRMVTLSFLPGKQLRA